MLYMFTYENLKQYAVLKAIGASERMLLAMIFVQASVSALLGAFIGIGDTVGIETSLSRTLTAYSKASRSGEDKDVHRGLQEDPSGLFSCVEGVGLEEAQLAPEALLSLLPELGPLGYGVYV
jgi:hypothetical protein